MNDLAPPALAGGGRGAAGAAGAAGPLRFPNNDDATLLALVKSTLPPPKSDWWSNYDPYSRMTVLTFARL